jgi:benzoyl-CoA reductase subunit A
MSVYLGIDLGSTTTKAVLIDEDEHVLGRGITNTRSDYHVATSVAEKEAEINARFTTLKRSAVAAAIDPRVLERLEGFFDEESFFFRLRRLRALARERAEARGAGGAKRWSGAVESIFNAIEAGMRSGSDLSNRLRTSFFRDVVGAAFMSRAEAVSAEFGLDFEDLMGVFDVVILLEENTVLDLDFGEILGRSPEVAAGNGSGPLATVVASAARATFTPSNMVGTGYGRQRLPFRPDQIRSEILCHGLGAHHMFPKTRTVLDIGGQDTKAIQVDDMGIATNFQMNDRCAAGCGRYLGYVADELNISLDDLGPLALEATRTVPISSTCTVFAGAELRERLELGEKREDILAGLHRAIVLRAMSLLARSGGVKDEFTFTGGVARNPAVVRELRELTRENYGERTMNIHQDSIYMGALGAALYARRDIPAVEITKGKTA